MDSGTKAHNGAGQPLEESRTIQNAGELCLLIRIYRDQGKDKEALDVLNDSRVVVYSSIARSWDLTVQKLELLQVCELWESLYDFCYHILTCARIESTGHPERTPDSDYGRFGDDWAVWKAMLEAYSHLQTTQMARTTKDLIRSFLHESPAKDSYNARVALVEFHDLTAVELENDADTLLSTSVELHQRYSQRASCFRNLSHVNLLSASDQSLFLSTIESSTLGLQKAGQAAWCAAEVNCLKQDYCVVISDRKNLNNTDLLSAFVANCLRLYKIALPLGNGFTVSERRPGDDAAILAAMGCVHLHKNGQKHALIRCVAILEALLSDSKHNYDAILMLIRVYTYLGAIPLAAKYWDRLDTKHLQTLGVSWIMFTRISTLHPHSCTNERFPLDPADALTKMLDWAIKTEKASGKREIEYLEHHSYNGLLDIVEHNRDMSNAYPKFMLTSELLRILYHGRKPFGRFAYFREILGKLTDSQLTSSRAKRYHQTRSAPDLGI
jgi:N-terminal acetyltransferase B complex non-catalytic subunit